LIAITLFGFCGVPWLAIILPIALLSVKSSGQGSPFAENSRSVVDGTASVEPMMVCAIYWLLALACFAGGRGLAG
jgi:hypothetical protein